MMLLHDNYDDYSTPHNIQLRAYVKTALRAALVWWRCGKSRTKSVHPHMAKLDTRLSSRERWPVVPGMVNHNGRVAERPLSRPDSSSGKRQQQQMVALGFWSLKGKGMKTSVKHIHCICCLCVPLRWHVYFARRSLHTKPPVSPAATSLAFLPTRRLRAPLIIAAILNAVLKLSCSSTIQLLLVFLEVGPFTLCSTDLVLATDDNIYSLDKMCCQ